VPRSDLVVLAQFRHSVRALNGAIERGSRGAGLTVQQQAFLLSLAARDHEAVQLADVRKDLGMDQATASELLARLTRRGLVKRRSGEDRRSVVISLTTEGRSRFDRSVRSIRSAIQAAHDGGDLEDLSTNIVGYLRYYGVGRTRGRRGR